MDDFCTGTKASWNFLGPAENQVIIWHTQHHMNAAQHAPLMCAVSRWHNLEAEADAGEGSDRNGTTGRAFTHMGLGTGRESDREYSVNRLSEIGPDGALPTRKRGSSRLRWTVATVLASSALVGALSQPSCPGIPHCLRGYVLCLVLIST